MTRVNKIHIEANSLQGRGVVKINTKKSNCEVKLKSFLASNGFGSIEPQAVIARIEASNKAQVRLEKLGFMRDEPLTYPRLGQSHELEFVDLRSKLPDKDTISHGHEFYSSSDKLNGVTALKIVSETLGETKNNATTEIVLGPAAIKDEYVASMTKVENFFDRVKPHTKDAPITMAEALDTPDSAQGVVWYKEDPSFEGPCLHTSRGVPIKDISTVLKERQSRLSSQASMLLGFAKGETDAFIAENNIVAPPGKKLWETINLAIWMSACEGVLHSLMPNGEHQVGNNKTINSWTKYAGKNFFGVITRFSAGDLLRSGGLQDRDVQQIAGLFATSDTAVNLKNFEKIVVASSNTAKKFVSYLANSSNKDYQDIAQKLSASWDKNTKESVLYWIRHDLRIDFIPQSSPARYPSDKPAKYGDSVVADTSSPSYAHSQFVPRREQIDADGIKAPVSGAFEFRSGEFVSNARLESYFRAGKKRTRKDLSAAWQHFSGYVSRVKKRARLGNK